MFWFFHRGLSPHLQRAHAGRTQCDPPNTYPLARRVLGRYAPGTRRASGPVPVIADVRKTYECHPQTDRNSHSGVAPFFRPVGA